MQLLVITKQRVLSIFDKKEEVLYTQIDTPGPDNQGDTEIEACWLTPEM